MATKADNEREWRRMLDEHASHTMHGVISICSDLIANSRAGELVDGRPTVEIHGPDGVWRRYLVRLTEAPKPLPFDPADLQGLRR